MDSLEQPKASESAPESASNIVRPGGFGVQVADITRLGIREPEWLIESVLPMNELALIYGAPKAGKSWVALEVARVLATSESNKHSPIFRPNTNVSSCPVVYVSPEFSADWVHERITLLDYNPTAAHNVTILTPDLLSNPNINSQMAPGKWDLHHDQGPMILIQKICHEIYESEGTPPLLILDPLNQFIGAADVNKPEGVLPYLNMLEKMTLQKYCAGVLLVHHERKRGQSTYRDNNVSSVYGSYVLTSRPKAFIRVEATSKVAALRFWGNHCSESHSVFLEKADDKSIDSIRIPFTVADTPDPSRRGPSGEKTEESIIQFLIENDRRSGWTSTQLEKNKVGNRRTLADALKRLEGRQKVESQQKGSYRIRTKVDGNDRK